MNRNERYLVAGSHAWSRKVFEETISKYQGVWKLVADGNEFDRELLRSFDPQYIFFLHWSWKIPDDILASYECVCFHMTDVPYGRGGSPLQNLIVRGHRTTKVTALRMVEEFDAGPVYLKEELSLEGSASEIYQRAAELSAAMIRRIIEEHPTPRLQEGEPTIFKRRRPAESEMRDIPSLESLYDFIRMLDAEGYPHAFLNHEGFRYEFTGAKLNSDSLSATVNITVMEPTK